jgi:hypothetical protein
VSFAAITLCVASQRVFIVVSVYFVIDSDRKLLDTPSYVFFDFRECPRLILLTGFHIHGSQQTKTTPLENIYVSLRRLVQSLKQEPTLVAIKRRPWGRQTPRPRRGTVQLVPNNSTMTQNTKTEHFPLFHHRSGHLVY